MMTNFIFISSLFPAFFKQGDHEMAHVKPPDSLPVLSTVQGLQINTYVLVG